MWESLKDGDKLFHSLCRSLDQHVFPLHHGSMQRNKGMKGNREIGVVIYGRIKITYLCFTDIPVFTIEFYFSLVE